MDWRNELTRKAMLECFGVEDSRKGEQELVASFVDEPASDPLVQPFFSDSSFETVGSIANRPDKSVRSICRQPLGGDTPNPFQISNIYRETETETDSRERFNLLPLNEFLARPEIELKWLVKRIIPAESIAILAGAPGVGKTWLLQDLVICCALGKPWLSKFDTNVERILYIDEESNEGLSKVRFRKLLAGRRISHSQEDILKCIRHGNQVGLRLDEDDSLQELERYIWEFQPQLVILDALVRLHGGDENSSRDMAIVFNAIKSLAQKYKCTFIIADHERKPSQYYARPETRLRGSSEKVAALDSMLSISKLKDGSLKFDHSKSRCGPPIDPLRLNLCPQDDGGMVIECETFSTKVRAEKKEDIQFMLLEIIKSKPGWTTRKEVLTQTKKLGFSAKQTDAELVRLKEAGQIEIDKRKMNRGRGGTSACYRSIAKR